MSQIDSWSISSEIFGEIKKFEKLICNERPPRAGKDKGGRFWDTTKIFDYWMTQPKNELLSLPKLRKKAISITAIHSAGRMSDLHKLVREKIIFTPGH